MADSTNVVKYGSRTFGEIKNDLIILIKQSYPELISDFSDSSVGTMLLDLNAGVGNNLSINTDRVFQETQLEYAQQKASILNIAKNMGFNLPAKRPSVTVVDFSVKIPVLGDSPDSSYYPLLYVGAQTIGAGNVFETQYPIDWSSSVSSLGDPNRSILPNFDSNGIIQNYTVTKREIVINGSSNIYKRVITSNDITPFFSITLPDMNIIEIDSIILLEGTSFTTNPSINNFYNFDNRFYEVEYLAQQRIFIEDSNKSSNNNQTSGIKAAAWINITKKFIKEFTPNGYCKITFGSGDVETNAFKEGFLKEGVDNRAFLENFLNNTALGERLKAGYTLFIKYRTGGGINSNVGAGTINSLGSYTIKANGARQDNNKLVEKSLKVNNPIPAIGGNDGLSVEQIRQLIKYNFSSQNRDVTLTDYLMQIYKMPGKFGSPYRANVFKKNNKIIISVLDIASDGKLSNSSNTLLKENIAEYLTQYRMVNDFIEVTDGKIFNLAIDVDVYIENINDNQVANSIITLVKDYFDITKQEMNQDIFLGKLQKEILNANGVINIIELKIYNKIGSQYSINSISQVISDDKTGQIKIINNTIYSEPDSMFEIKYPEKDIRVYLRKRNE